MSRPLSETTQNTRIAELLHRVRQLERRPVPVDGGSNAVFAMIVKVVSEARRNQNGWTASFTTPAALNGKVITAVHAFVSGASSSGKPEMSLTNAGVAVCTTNPTIDVGELSSYTAAVPPVLSINSSAFTLVTGNLLLANVVASGTGSTGAGIIIEVG